MRITKFAALLVLILAGPGWAGPARGQTYVGIGLGGTTSWRERRSGPFIFSSNQNRETLAAALSLHQSLTGWLELSTGVAWTGKGFDRTGPTLHIRYLEVPAVIAFAFRPRSVPLGLTLGGGVTAGWVISCKRFIGRPVTTYEDGCRDASLPIQVLESDLRRWDVTGELRVRLLLRVGGGQWFAMGRYSESLGDIEPDRRGRTVNQLVQLMVGYEWLL